MTRVSDHHKVKTAFIGGSIKLPPEWPVWVMSGPAGHKRAWQVCPGKLPLQPSEHRRICSAKGGAISDPGRAIIGSSAKISVAPGAPT
jgi:hypothetical protein